MLDPRATILLLEDEPRVAAALVSMLQALGWAVVLASSVECAQRLFVEHGDIAAVVADYRMNSEATGLDFLAWAHEQHTGVKRVLLSGQPSEGLERQLRGTCHTFLAKPFKMHELDAALAS